MKICEKQVFVKGAIVYLLDNGSWNYRIIKEDLAFLLLLDLSLSPPPPPPQFPACKQMPYPCHTEEKG